MKSFRRFVLLAAITAFSLCPHLLPAAPPDSTAFVLVRSVRGVNLYERWYPIAGDKRAREVKAVMRVNADPSAAVALLKDEARGTDWNSATRSYDVVAGADNTWMCHIEYDFPWPVSNQDCVLQYRKRYMRNRVEVAFTAVDHPSFPVRNKVRRIPGIAGKWIFTELPSGTAVEYFITTTPSSVLPAWVTDPIIRDNLIATMTSFRDILETPEN